MTSPPITNSLGQDGEFKVEAINPHPRVQRGVAGHRHLSGEGGCMTETGSLIDCYWKHWSLFKWHFLDYRGRPCRVCGLSEAAHHDHTLEWDIDNYPCEKFKISGEPEQ